MMPRTRSPREVYDRTTVPLLDALERLSAGEPIDSRTEIMLSHRRLVTFTGALTDLGQAVLEERDRARSRVLHAELTRVARLSIRGLVDELRPQESVCHG